MTFCHQHESWHAGGVLELIDGFILHLATERGLSTNYQILVRGFLEAFASWFKEAHDSESPAQVTTDHITSYLARRKKDGIATSSARVAAKPFSTNRSSAASSSSPGRASLRRSRLGNASSVRARMNLERDMKS